MIKLADDSYAIIKHKGKPKLAFVLNARGRNAVLDETLHLDESINFKFEPEDVLCSLGTEPKIGSIYGIKVEPYLKTISTEQYGPIHFFRTLDKAENKALRSALKKVHALFKKHASTEFLPVHGIHIMHKKGKYAGSYTAKSKGSEVFDIVKFHPEAFSDEEYNMYLIAHEWAHGLWARCVSRRTRAKWMKLYQKRMKLNNIKQNHMEELCESIISYEGGLNAYSREVGDEDENMIIKEVVNFFKRHHSMDKADIELMIEHDSKSLADMWPHAALLTKKRVDISEYAMTKCAEFFAEAVAMDLCKKELPKDIKKALQYTYKLAKGI